MPLTLPAFSKKLSQRVIAVLAHGAVRGVPTLTANAKAVSALAAQGFAIVRAA